MIKLGILSSTRGSHILPLIGAINSGLLPASIDVIVSDKTDAPVLRKAEDLGIKGLFLDPQGMKRSDYDMQLDDIFCQFRIDLILLIGFMRILSPQFIERWPKKIINVHPSLLPAHAGLMDLAVHQAVLDAGEQETGCSVHFVTEQVDGGPIIVQKKCAVIAGDNAEELKARVQQLEGNALIEAILFFTGKKS